MTDFIKYARKRGLIPDWVWYQTNGKSAQENWIEQREKMKERYTDQETAEEARPQVTFTSEVKLK